MIVLALLLAFAEPKVTATEQSVAVIDATRMEEWRALSSKELQSVGTVSLIQTEKTEQVPMLGEWSTQDSLVFTPRFGFEPGMKYRLNLTSGYQTTFVIPAVKPVPGKLLKVQPLSNQLPANLLRFYLHFDSEMKPGQGYKHFQLLDENGKLVADAFLELDEELWSADGKRLTLLLHPGRVKRALKPREELGPVLEEGKSYTLRIVKEFQTIKGAPLEREFRRKFKVGPAMETGLDPQKWTYISSSQSVEVKFDRPMDHALKNRVIRIETKDGQTVEGSLGNLEIDANWKWFPKKPLPAGEYAIVIDDVLEDVCGNRIGVAFDAKLGEVGARAAKAPTRIPFQIK